MASAADCMIVTQWKSKLFGPAVSFKAISLHWVAECTQTSFATKGGLAVNI